MIGLEMTTEKCMVGNLRGNKVSKIALSNMYILVKIYSVIVFYRPPEALSCDVLPLTFLKPQPSPETKAILTLFIISFD